MAEEIINLPVPPVATEPAAEPVQGAAPATPPSLDRADKLAFAVATLLAMVVYLVTLAPEVTLEDSGVLATSAAYAGVPGPPGFPVWTLYSWFFTKALPFSNIAWRISVGSAVAGALLCGVVAMMVSSGAKMVFNDAGRFQKFTVREWEKLRIVGGAVAGLVLGFNGLFWHEAVIVDYWALSLLLFAAVLWLLSRVCFDPNRRGLLCVAFLLFGMLLTSNQEMLVALPGLVCLVMSGNLRLGRDLALFVLPLAAVLTAVNGWNAVPWPFSDYPWNWPTVAAFAIVIFIGIIATIATRSVGSHWKSALSAALCLTAGLAFYLYLPIASMSTPPVNWAYPRTLDGFLHALSRGQYERGHPTDSFSHFAQQFGMFLKETGEDFGWLYLLIALVGVCSPCAVNRRGRRWLAGLAAVWICTGPLMVALLNPANDNQSVGLIVIYFSASKIILAVLMGLGLIILGTWMSRFGDRQETSRTRP